jgi:hypothetical protein
MPLYLAGDLERFHENACSREPGVLIGVRTRNSLRECHHELDSFDGCQPAGQLSRSDCR